MQQASDVLRRTLHKSINMKRHVGRYSFTDNFPPVMNGGASALATLPTGSSTSGGWASG